jgi:hypothetical protein
MLDAGRSTLPIPTPFRNVGYNADHFPATPGVFKRVLRRQHVGVTR